jgi:hypothetical protein
MKTHRILGILWLALCSYFCFNLLRALLELHPTAGGLWVAWSVLAGSCLLYLAGIVASIFLVRGRPGARWLLGFIALIVLLQDTAFFVTMKQVPIQSAVICCFAVLSTALLFWPRHEPVA